MCTKFSLEFLKERNHSEDPGTDGRIILKWVVREMRLEVVDWIHLAADKNRWCEHGKEPLGSMRGGKFLD
jgi:hypothetical protein